MKKSLIFKTLKLLVLTGLLIGLVLLTTTRAFAEGNECNAISEKRNDTYCMTIFHFTLYNRIRQLDDNFYYIQLLTKDRECFSFNLTPNLKDCMIRFNEEWQKLIDDPDIRDRTLQHYRESATEVRYCKDKGLVSYVEINNE